MTFRSKVTYLRFSLCKRPQREQYKSYAEVGNTTEGSELPRFVKSCHMRKPCERKELFDDWAESYDESLEDAAGFPFEGYEQVLSKIVGGAEVGEGDRILDVGTGTGALAARFAELGCRVLGTDLSEKMLAQAQRNVPKADFKQLDLLGDWDGLEAQHFGAIVSAYVFHEFSLATKLELLTRLSGSLERVMN